MKNVILLIIGFIGIQAYSPNKVLGQVNGMLENIYSYKIIDLAGQLVVQQLNLYGQNVRLDVSQLPKGMYTIVVQAGTQKESKRILVK